MERNLATMELTHGLQPMARDYAGAGERQEQRHKEVHRLGADVAEGVEMVSVSKIPPKANLRGPFDGREHHWSGPPGTPEPKVGQKICHFQNQDGTLKGRRAGCKPQRSRFMDEVLAKDGTTNCRTAADRSVAAIRYSFRYIHEELGLIRLRLRPGNQLWAMV